MPDELAADDVVARTRQLLERTTGRVVIGVVKALGAGKSTQAEHVVSAVPGPVAVAIPHHCATP